MKLSIIVPVYNMAGDGKLNFCLDSLIKQNIKDYEIITVNDASTDNSLEVLNCYAAKYPDLVKVISYSDNRHQGGARNEGIRHAQGDWIGFIDSDDWISPDFYSKLISKGEETGADVVGCNYSIVSEHTYTVGEIDENPFSDCTGILDEAKHKFLFANPGSMVIKVYRRNLIIDNNLSFPEHIFYEDNAAGPLWSLYFKHFEFINEPLYYYYQHSSSTVHTITEERSRNRLQACNILLKEMKERGLYESYKTELEAIFINLYLVNTLFGYMINCPRKRFGFVLEIKKGMLEAFPDFLCNPAFEAIKDEEEKRMVRLLIKNSLLFYYYYRFIWFVRRLR